MPKEINSTFNNDYINLISDNSGGGDRYGLA